MNLRILAHGAVMPFRPSAAQQLNPQSTSKHSQASLGSQQSIHSTILVWKHATKPNRETCETSTLLQSILMVCEKMPPRLVDSPAYREPSHHQLSYQYYSLALENHILRTVSPQASREQTAVEEEYFCMWITIAVLPRTSGRQNDENKWTN